MFSAVKHGLVIVPAFGRNSASRPPVANCYRFPKTPRSTFSTWTRQLRNHRKSQRPKIGIESERGHIVEKAGYNDK